MCGRVVTDPRLRGLGSISMVPIMCRSLEQALNTLALVIHQNRYQLEWKSVRCEWLQQQKILSRRRVLKSEFKYIHRGIFILMLRTVDSFIFGEALIFANFIFFKK